MDNDKLKRQSIFEAASRARTLLETLKSGKHIMDTKGHEPETVDRKLCELLHFRQYVQMYKFAFETWDLSGIEQTYIEIGGEAKELNDLLSHDVFKETLFSLLWIRSEIDHKTIEEVHEKYMDRIGLEWIEAGLIRNMTHTAV
jgi:hypothetical protein